MKRKRLPPNDPREWIRRAESNLAHSRAISPEVCLEDLCFDAQQGAEKAIKAVFISRGETFPYIHELKKLLGRLRRDGLGQAARVSPRRPHRHGGAALVRAPGCCYRQMAGREKVMALHANFPDDP